jgi:hypothetical protein
LVSLKENHISKEPLRRFGRVVIDFPILPDLERHDVLKGNVSHALVCNIFWLSNRVQISTDSFNPYADAVERALGADVDYGVIVKFYDAEPIGPGRYGLRA